MGAAKICRSFISTPMGDILIVAQKGSLIYSHWSSKKNHEQTLPLEMVNVPKDQSVLERASGEIRAYFAGELSQFSLPYKFVEGTDFQKGVWREIAKIPFGETVSYSTLARSLGVPQGVRPVASACGANPLLLLIPCHRVLRKNGNLGGFAAGLDVKKTLLKVEGAY